MAQQKTSKLLPVYLAVGEDTLKRRTVIERLRKRIEQQGSLEFNHDLLLLEGSGRPWSLIQRIRGRSGHLSNEQASALLARIASPRLRRLVPAHLSSECNRPDLADAAALDALRAAGAPREALVEPRFPTPLFDLPA